jgi:DNA-binding NarL/FixJ family response regulator
MRQSTKHKKKIRILLIDDHAAIRMGVTAAAADADDMEVVAELENGAEALEAFRKHRPDVVVLDLRLQGASGVETIVQLRKEFEAARIVVFTGFPKGEEIYRALKYGASGFALKGLPTDRLLKAIRTVHSGASFIPPEITSRIGERLLVQMSPRELEILQWLAKGRSNKEIAAQLEIVEGTVKMHISKIFSKLGVADRTQALIEAVKRGIVQIDD